MKGKKFKIEKILCSRDDKYIVKSLNRLYSRIKTDGVDNKISELRSMLRGDDDETMITMTKNTKFGDITKSITCSDNHVKTIHRLNITINNEIRARRKKLRDKRDYRYISIADEDIAFSGGLIDLKLYNKNNYTTFASKMDLYKHLHNGRYRRCFSTSNKSSLVGFESKCIGIELEFGAQLNRDKLAIVLAGKLGKTCRHLYIKGDGSLRSSSYSYLIEMTIMAKEDEIQDVVIKTCNALNEIGVGVNKTCGLHVHLDMRDKGSDYINNTWCKLINWQDTLYATQPESRRKYTGKGTGRSRGFCQKIDLNMLMDMGCRHTLPAREIYGNGDLGRYCGINGASYYKYSTLEVRMHSGTTNAYKICSWIKLILAIRDSDYMPTSSISIADLTALGLDSEAIHYFIDRCTKFGTYHGEPIAVRSISEAEDLEMPEIIESRLPALAANVVEFIKQNSYVDDNFENYNNDLDYVTN